MARSVDVALASVRGKGLWLRALVGSAPSSDKMLRVVEAATAKATKRDANISGAYTVNIPPVTKIDKPL